MRKRYTLLGFFRDNPKNKKCFFVKFFGNLKIRNDNNRVTKTRKLLLLKRILMMVYKDYSETTGYNEVSYYEKAELRLKRIIEEDKIDYYYNLLKRLRKYL